MTDSDQRLSEELERARTLATDGLLGEALIQVRRIIRDCPHLAEAHYLLAALLSAQKGYDEALEAAERCLQLDPQHSRAKEIRDTCQEALNEKASRPQVTTFRPDTFVYEAKKTKVSMRRCPSCGEKIVRGAQICRHCGAHIGMPPWIRKIALGVIGLGIVFILFYLAFSVIGRGDLEPEPQVAQEADVGHPSKAGGFPWGRFILMSVLSGILLFGSARLQVACNAKLPWDYELKADALSSVIAVPVITACNAWLFFILYGSTQVNLGPIVILAVVAPFLLLLLAIAYLFRRGCGGLLLIWLFYNLLYASFYRLIR